MRIHHRDVEFSREVVHEYAERLCGGGVTGRGGGGGDAAGERLKLGEVRGWIDGAHVDRVGGYEEDEEDDGAYGFAVHFFVMRFGSNRLASVFCCLSFDETY